MAEKEKKKPNRSRFKNVKWHTVNLIEHLEELGFNPLSELVKELSMIDEAKDRADVLLKLLEYIFPKRKAVDITATTTTAQVSLTPQQLAGLLSSDMFRQAIPVQATSTEDPKSSAIESPQKIAELPKDPFA